MRYRLRHTTSYSYSWPVDMSYHLLHLTLQSGPRQTVTDCAVHTAPEGRTGEIGRDHFGNLVSHLSIEEPHTRFDVELTAEVDVQPFTAPPEAETPPWESIRDLLNGDGFPKAFEPCEFALGSPMADADDAIAAYAAQSLPPGRPILAAARELTKRIHDDFRYDPTATEVFTPVAEAMKQRAGVCQDFAHLQIAMLRSHGLAARYVSGYIRTMQPGDENGLRGADASHAWVSVWCGDAHGWIDLDPTNDLVVSEDHVTLAVGRDYNDISPVRGVVLGGGPHRVGVAVELLPLDAPPKQAPAQAQGQSQGQTQTQSQSIAPPSTPKA